MIEKGTTVKPPYIRNDFLSFIYRSMLDEFSKQEMREFFHRFEGDAACGSATGKAFYDLINDPKTILPYDFVINVLNSLETFFVSKNHQIKRFLQGNLVNYRTGSPVSTNFSIYMILPFLGALLTKGDPRVTFLKNIHLANERIRPGTLQKTVRLTKSENGYAALLVFAHDPSFSYTKEMFDGELFIALTMQYSLTRFGMEPLDGYKMLTDASSAEMRFEPGRASRSGGLFFIDGRPYGKIQDFREFLIQKDIPVPRELQVPTRDVVVMDEDFYCPVRERVVLHNACAYGAPLYSYEVFFKPSEKKERLLKKLSTELRFEPEISALGKKLHHEFLEYVDDAHRFKYSKETMSIYLNDRYITQGVQAGILYQMISTVTQQNRFVFSHKEFTDRRDLISAPENPGFVTRLNRVSQKLSKLDSGIRIKKTGRGEFMLVSTKPVILSEE